MAITFNCSSCSKRLKVSDALAGKNARCPICGSVISVPASTPMGGAPAPGPAPAAPPVTAPASPPAAAPSSPAAAGQWYYMSGTTRCGPVSREDIIARLRARQLNHATPVWRAGMAQWSPAGSLPEFSAAAPAPPPVPGGPRPGAYPPRPGYAPPQAGYPRYGPGQTAQGNGKAVAGMVLGIISVALSCVWCAGLPISIVGLILSISGKNKSKITGTGSGMATAGIVLNVIALALGVLFMIVGLASMGGRSSYSRYRF